MATLTSPTNMDSNEATPTGAPDWVGLGGEAGDSTCAVTKIVANINQMAKTAVVIFWKAMFDFGIEFFDGLLHVMGFWVLLFIAS